MPEVIELVSMDGRMGIQDIWPSVSCFAMKREMNCHAQNLSKALDPEVADEVGRCGRGNKSRIGGWRNRKCNHDICLSWPSNSLSLTLRFW